MTTTLPRTDDDFAVTGRAWQTLFITSVSMFLVAMDVTIVSVALPGITKEFPGASSATLSWVFTAYNITFAALLLLAGKVGDFYGRKRAFLVGLLVFVGASLLAALAPSAGILIFARTIQALGSALIYPASLALLLPEFPISRRSMAIGVWGGIAGLGGAVAPTLGALLVEWAGWRAVFFVNVPFVAAAFIGGLFVLRENYGENRERFDPVAVPVAAAAVGLLVLAVVQGQPWGWTSGKVIAAFAAAAFALPIFVMRSSSHPRPLLDLDLFRLRSFTVANASQCLFVASFYGWLVLMPSFFEDVWGWSPLAAGFALAPSAALSAILSPVAGRLADRIGHRWLVGLGALVGAAGPLWWALFVGRTPHYATAVLPGMILGGLGATAGFATATGAIMSEVAPKHYSMAGAARSTVFQLASAIGIAVAVALLGTPVAGAVAPYARVWWVAAAESLAGAILMVTLFPSHPKKPRVTTVSMPAGATPPTNGLRPEPQPAPSASAPA